MKKELVALEPELKKKSEDTQQLMERLVVDQEQADAVSSLLIPVVWIVTTACLLRSGIEPRTPICLSVMGNGENRRIEECISVYECMSEIVYTLPSQEQKKTVNSDLSSNDRQWKMTGSVSTLPRVRNSIHTHCPLRSRTELRFLICPEMMGK